MSIAAPSRLMDSLQPVHLCTTHPAGLRAGIDQPQIIIAPHPSISPVVLGNCSCVALGRCSRQLLHALLSTVAPGTVLPPASVQSYLPTSLDCLFLTQATSSIPGVVWVAGVALPPRRSLPATAPALLYLPTSLWVAGTVLPPPSMESSIPGVVPSHVRVGRLESCGSQEKRAASRPFSR